MGNRNKKMWAMILVVAMVTSTFVGLSSIVWGTDTTPEPIADIKSISSELIAEAFYGFDVKQPVNENALNRELLSGPTPMSPPPEPETKGTWTYDFDADTVDQLPADPPWTAGAIPGGQVSFFGPDDFEDDVLGGMPDNPPWNAEDGSALTVYWGNNFDHLNVGDPITESEYMGTDGYFGTWNGDATLTAETPPAGGPSGSIVPGLNTGPISAYFNEGAAEGVPSYWGPAGIGGAATSSSYAGGWVYLEGNNNEWANNKRLDLIVVEGGTWATMIEIAFYPLGGAGGASIVHWPGGGGVDTGVDCAGNSWHELYVLYDEVADDYTIYLNGAAIAAGSAFFAPTDDINGMLWFGGDSGNFPATAYIDNFYHFDPPAGFTHNVEVQDVGGDQCVYVDQDNVAAGNGLAQFYTDFDPLMAGQGYWDFMFRTDATAANTNGAVAALYDQSGNAPIAIRASGGQFQYRSGGGWTDLQAFGASTWYNIFITFDTVAKTYTVDIDASSYGPFAFDRDSGTLAGVIYRGTGSTQSEHHIDDVEVYCDGAGTNITVSNFASNSAPNALRIQEYNADDYAVMGADMAAAGTGAVGTFTFWFYSTDNWGGQQMQIEGDAIMTVIGIGQDLFDGSNNAGNVQFLDGNLILSTEETYTVNTWNSIDIEYDAVSDTYSYRWNGGPLTGPYAFYQPCAYLSYAFIIGGAPECPGDFLYDDFNLFVNEMPGAPTNCWTEEPGGGVESWDNYTVDQDIPVEGIVTGDYTNIDEKPPAVPDGATEDIQEAPGGAVPVTLLGPESFEGAWPPAGWTETGRWNGEPGPGGLPDGALCADFDGGVGQSGDLDTPGIDTSTSTSVTIDFYYQTSAACEAGDLTVYYYDNTGAWDAIQQIGDPGAAWLHYSDTTADAQYQHAGFQVRWAAVTTAANEDCYVDYVIINGTATAGSSLEHRWRTENIAGGAMQLDLYVRGRHNTGSDDTFTIGVSNNPGGPYTPTAITINSDVMTTYSDSIIGFSGVIYINVIDDNTGDAAQDTVFIDTIWIYYYSVGGSVTTTQITTADIPIDGTVTGTHVLTNPPADGSAQEIAEVAATSTGDPPIERSPGPGPTPLVDIMPAESFEGAFPPPGWTTIDSPADRNWQQATDGVPYPTDFGGFLAYVNYDPAYAQDEWLISPSQDCSGYQNLLLHYHIHQGTGWNEHIYIRVSTDGGGSWSGNLVDHFQSGLTLTAPDMQTLDLSAYDLQPNVQIAFILWTAAADAGDSIGLDYVTLTGDVAGNTLEHRWQIEDMPADSITRTLYVTARHNTGSDDTFSFEWSEDQITWNPTTITVNTDGFVQYSDSISVAFVGPLYVRVLDDNGGDATTDSVFIDEIYVESEVSAASTDIVVHWDLSVDDGGGEMDVTQYNIYRADEEDGDDISGPYTLIGSSLAGATTYNDVGEGADLVNQAWYYVEAQDAAQANASGYFSKLNFAPVMSNVLADGWSPVLIISPGTPSVTLTATANDDSNHHEAIPNMDGAEYYIDPPGDPGEGLGTPIDPTDAVWDTMAEDLLGTVDTSLWVPGTYNIWVRARETDYTAALGYYTVWGAPLNVTVEVVDGPPVADAGPDQTVPQHTVVTFDGSLSTDDVGITNYWWNFTDIGPQTLTGVAPFYTFDNEGIFVVTLEVMDTIGQTDTDTMIVNVTDGDPPMAEAGPDQTGIPADIITFDGTASYDPGHLGEPIIDGIVNWTWTFDDGTGLQTLYDPNPTHQFNLPGSFLVTLMVTDAAPAPGPWTDTDTMYVNISEIFDVDITEAMLSDDWILISFPNQIEGDPLTIVVDAIDEGPGYVQWDVVQWFDPQSAPGTEWKTTATFKPPPLNTFTYVNNSIGFWIHISNYGDGTLTITGPLSNTGDDGYLYLFSGWNLVGYPHPTAQPSADTFGGSFEIDNMYCYDSSDPYRLRFYNWMGTEDHEPGKGYWVHVTNDEILWMGCP